MNAAVKQKEARPVEFRVCLFKADVDQIKTSSNVRILNEDIRGMGSFKKGLATSTVVGCITAFWEI